MFRLRKPILPILTYLYSIPKHHCQIGLHYRRCPKTICIISDCFTTPICSFYILQPKLLYYHLDYSYNKVTPLSPALISPTTYPVSPAALIKVKVLSTSAGSTAIIIPIPMLYVLYIISSSMLPSF